MTETVADKITPLFAALEALPEEAQDAVIAEAKGLAADLSRSLMAEEQRQEIQRQLAEPRQFVSHEDVRALLRRYNTAP